MSRPPGPAERPPWSSPDPATAPRRGGRTLEALGAAALMGLVLAVALTWCTAVVAGLVFRGRTPGLSAADALSATVRWPAHVGDPRAAWPAPTRRQLPATVALYGVATVLAAAGALLVAAGTMARRRVTGWWAERSGMAPASWSPRPSPVGQPRRGRGVSPVGLRGRGGGLSPVGLPGRGGRTSPGARWATSPDLARLAVRDPVGDRLVLGRVGRTLVATEARHSVLVLGPTQSGKSTGLAIPALLEWDGPVLATSVKGDLVEHSRAWRAGRGRTWVFDPTGSAGAGPTSRWSPLQEASTWTGAQRMAAWLVDATPARTGLSEGAFWFAAAAKLLAPLLLAAGRGGRTMADVVRWTDLQEGDEVEAILGQAGEVEAGVALFASLQRDERIRSSIYTTLETVLAPYQDPVVAASAETPDISPAELVRGAHTLYLCGPAHEQARVQGVFAALTAAVVNAAVERVHHTGRPLDPPLLLVLDEVANIAPLRDLDTLASTGAGMGIQLVTVCQDLAQLAVRYGQERARTIANNHRAKVILSGVADVGTLDTLSGLAGEQAVREHTVTADLRDGRRTTSSSLAYRRLAPADELRRIRPGEGVLVYGYLPPARLRLRPWYADATLRRKASS